MSCKPRMLVVCKKYGLDHLPTLCANSCVGTAVTYAGTHLYSWILKVHFHMHTTRRLCSPSTTINALSLHHSTRVPPSNAIIMSVRPNLLPIILGIATIILHLC